MPVRVHRPETGDPGVGARVTFARGRVTKVGDAGPMLAPMTTTLYVPLCAACNEPLTRAPTGRPRLYCSPRCRKAASRERARGYTWLPPADPPAGLDVDVPAPDALAAALVAPDAPLDEQVAGAVLAALTLAGVLHRLGREARPRFAWRCETLAAALDAALADTFAGVV